VVLAGGWWLEVVAAVRRLVRTATTAVGSSLAAGWGSTGQEGCADGAGGVVGGRWCWQRADLLAAASRTTGQQQLACEEERKMEWLLFVCLC